MFDDVTVIGAGRAGSAIASRLRERGILVRENGLCASSACPTARSPRCRLDRARPVGRTRLGGTPLAALDPHVLRFSVHRCRR